MSDDNSQPQSSAEEADERAVQSIPLDTEDGGTVVIEQQNMGGSQQVGGGEYKNLHGRTVEQAAAEQAELEREAPIGHDGQDEGADG
jgi:hypothetical protein